MVDEGEAVAIFPRKPKKSMKALWIDLPAGAMNVAAAFRLVLDLPDGRATLRLAAADACRLWIDGRLAAHGPARTAHGYARVDEIPLPPGHVVVFAEVYSAHVPCFDGVNQDAFFAAEVVADDGRILAATPDFEAWRDLTLVQRVRRISCQRGFVESRRLAADPAAFRRGDAAPEGYVSAASVRRTLPRLLPRGVSYPQLAFHDAGAPTGIFPIASAPDTTPTLGREVALYDFGRILAGFLSLRVRAATPSGATVLVAFDEILAPDGAPFPVDPFRGSWTRIVKWRLAPGDYDLLAFHPATVRYAAVDVTEGDAEIAQIGVVDFENPDKSRASLPSTDDATLDAIVAAARETFAQNAVDIFTDCPSRERAGWLFDSFFTGRAEALFTGRNLVERAFLENYALAPQLPELPDGMIPKCYPAEALSGSFIPNWALWWLLELREYLDRTGDESIVAASRPKIMALLGWFRSHENTDGLLENLPGWVFVEWSPCNDKDHVCGVNFPTNFLYAEALEAAGALLGDPATAAHGAAVREAAAHLAWNGEWFEDNAVRGEDGALRLAGHVTETGQYYAFYFGVATPETHATLWERLCGEFGPGRAVSRAWQDIPPYNILPGVYLRLELLLRHGRAGQCLEECRIIFGPMACLSGTLWEHLAPGDSMCHGFAATAACLIHDSIDALRRHHQAIDKK